MTLMSMNIVPNEFDENKDMSINGVIESVVHRNDQTGFAVIDLDCAGELITVVGELPGVSEGEELKVWGRYAVHPTYGLQFKSKVIERILPSSATAIQKYLKSGVIRGIGHTTARRIVDAFGTESLEIIAHEPEKLTLIKGISSRKAREISDEFSKIYGVHETLAKLTEMGFETADTLLLHRAYADAAVELITDNPYIACGYPVYKEFEFADKLALRMGILPDSINRIRAGLIYVLHHNLLNGHTCLPCDKLIDTAYRFLDLPHDTVEIALYEAVEDNTVSLAQISGEERVFINEMYRAEIAIAERLSLLNSLEYQQVGDVQEMIDAFEKRNNISYESAQRRAIEWSLNRGAVVITGGPGTGKTTTVNAIIDLCEENDETVALCAPTGRAAKRLSDLTGREAKTIHRLLEVQIQRDDELRFVHDENNPLSCSVVVVDEMSMVDVSLFEALLRGILPQCRLIMVGDFHQLPSVGAGNLLRDIIESGRVETIEFTQIFRQAAQSLIVVNAHSIVAGNQPDLQTKNSDFFFLPGDKLSGSELIRDLAARRLPKAYNLDPLNDIQVLTPSKKGTFGTYLLNDLLRGAMNPPAEDRAEVSIMGQLYREGDKVMQIKNNYDIEWQKPDGEQGVGAFNGDIGIIDRIDRKTQTIRVIFDDRYIRYSFEQARQLEAAFAVTVHKSQGSEFDAVILAVSDFSPKLCYRNLLYTAVTRARKLLVVVGEENLISGMVSNDRKMQRYTGLRFFLNKSD